MRATILLLAIVALVAAQRCDFCDNPLTRLATTIEVCGDDELHTYRVLDFSLIALGSETLEGNIHSSTSGDVEGRVLAANDLILEGGWSVGDKIVNYPPPASPWEQRAYSVVVGGDVDWQEGQINPVKDDDEHRRETGIYYGSSTAAPYLPFTRCTNGPLDLSAVRTALQTLSTAWSTAPTNSEYVVSDDGQVITLLGDDANDCDYLVRITAEDWNAHRGFIPMRWNVGANVVVDIVCDGIANPVYFQQGEFPGIAENIVYNFGPSCEGVTIVANSVHGSILAPWSTLDQSDGRIWGNVYVGEVAQVLQINVIDCPPNPDSCDCCDLC